MFQGLKRIVSSLKTIFETNRYRRRDGEVVTLHPQIPCLSERQRKDEGGHGKMENKYPIREFIRFCCDSIPHRLITI